MGFLHSKRAYPRLKPLTSMCVCVCVCVCAPLACFHDANLCRVVDTNKEKSLVTRLHVALTLHWPNIIVIHH